MSRPTVAFDCDIYVPRQRPDRDWMIEVCHILWCHGMKFLTPSMLVGTWNEQLHTTPPFQPYSGKSLIGQIDDIVEEGFGSLFCYDHDVQFEVRVDTDLRIAETFLGCSSEQEAMRKRLPLGKLELNVRYPAIKVNDRLPALPPDQIPPSTYLIPPYQHIHVEVIHLAEILCLKLCPAFAVGYYATDAYIPDELDFLCGFDIVTITALEQNQFPPLRDWLESIYVLYIPGPLMASSEAEAWFSSPTMWTRRLPDGGGLAYAMPETLDDIRIKEFNAACQEILKQNDRSRFPLAHIYIQRAQEIAAITQRQPDYDTTRLLSQLEYVEQHPDIFG